MAESTQDILKKTRSELEARGLLTGPVPISQFTRSYDPLKVEAVGRNIHADLHHFVDETRTEFKDTLPFRTWLGVCKRFSMWELHTARAWVRRAKARSPAKLFFWKLKEERKMRIIN